MVFLLDRWRVRRGGRLLFAENIAARRRRSRTKLAQPAVAKGGVAHGNVLMVPGDETLVAAVRAAAGRFRGEVGISAWNGLAVARLWRPTARRCATIWLILLTALRGGRLPRLWLN